MSNVIDIRAHSIERRNALLSLRSMEIGKALEYLDLLIAVERAEATLLVERDWAERLERKQQRMDAALDRAATNTARNVAAMILGGSR